MPADDPFRLLDLPRRFSLTDAELSAAMRKASMTWHPDRFAMASAEERNQAEQRMADLNEAFEQLADPLQRIALLLELDAKERTASPAFLMEMMEFREDLASAQDAGQNDKVIRLLQQLGQDYQERLERLGEAAESACQGHPAKTTRESLGALFTEATYLRQSREELARQSRPA
jgi:molecular chaperone HscB